MNAVQITYIQSFNLLYYESGHIRSSAILRVTTSGLMAIHTVNAVRHSRSHNLQHYRSIFNICDVYAMHVFLADRINGRAC